MLKIQKKYKIQLLNLNCQNKMGQQNMQFKAAKQKLLNPNFQTINAKPYMLTLTFQTKTLNKS